MSRLGKNVVANLFGNLWPAIMSLAFIPLYIRFMGIEAFGLVGFFSTLQGIFNLFDMGLSATINREMARFSTQADKGREMRNLARSLEVIYWLMAIFIGLAVVSLSPFIAKYWLKSNSLSTETVEYAIMVMGLAMVFRWPHAFYSGGLMGLQKQLALNVLKIFIETLRNGGVILILWLYSPTIVAFFSWQIFIYFLNIVFLALLFWSEIPPADSKPKFCFQSLLAIWRFAAGMAGVSILSMFHWQLDKVILSKWLPLNEFGYYMLATSVANGLFQLIYPINSAVYPRLTQLVTLGDQKQLADLYHVSCQVMSVVILPIAVEVAFFSKAILLLWTRSPDTAEHSYRILSALMAGSAINGLLNLPLALILAHGWSSFPLYGNCIAVVVFVPLLFFLTSKFGVMGAAFSWVALNSGIALISMYIMHRRLLPGHLFRWYTEDIGKPMAIILVVVAICYRFFLNQNGLSNFSTVLFLAITYFLSLFSCLMAFEFTRKVIKECLGRISLKFSNLPK